MHWVSRFTRYFLKNKQLSFLLFIFVVFGGLFALSNMRREGFPQVPVKLVVVSAIYRGADSTEVERSVTIPIESAIKDVKAVKQISSTTSDGLAIVRILLNEDANADAALQAITTATTKAELPKEVDRPTVFQPSSGSQPFVFGITGDLSERELLTQGRIFEYQMSQVKGIKSVTLDSSFAPKIQIVLDPLKMNAMGVDFAKISEALTTSNLNFPAGKVTTEGSQSSLIVQGAYTSLEAIGSTLIPSSNASQTVKLSDLATITQIIDQSGKLNHIGHRENGRMVSRLGLLYSVDIRGDADILHVEDDINKALARVKDQHILSSNVQVVNLFDQAKDTHRQIKEIEAGAIGEFWTGIGPLGVVGFVLGGISLLVLAMLLFVNIRTALIAGVAIPLSFLFTVLCLWLFGITLNTLTLFSMILVLGLVVDPAIVVLESIQRYKDMGHNGTQAALEAVGNIGNGVFMAVLTSIVVFVPFGIVSGVFGQIIKFIPITVIPALIASFFVPLIFLTFLGAKFMRPSRPQRRGKSEEESLWRVSAWFKRANLFILRHLSLQIVIIVVLAILPLAVAGFFVGTGKVKSVQFSKPNDQLFATSTIHYPASSTGQFVQELAAKVEAVFASHSEIVEYYISSQNSGTLIYTINLSQFNERLKTSEKLVEELKRELPNNDKTIYSNASSIGVGAPESEFPVAIQAFDADLVKLKTFAVAAGEYARSLDGVSRVNDGYTQAALPVLAVKIKPEVASRYGISTASLGAQLNAIIGEQKLTKVQIGAIDEQVVAVFDKAPTSENIESLQNLIIASPRGSVKLSVLATIGQEFGAGAISRLDGNRYALVQVAIKDNVDSGKVQKSLSDWAKAHRQEFGLADTALENKGEGNDIAKSFGELFLALLLSLILTYFILVLFFKSFLQPLIITFAVPLSFIGVFPVLWAVKSQFGFLEILGLITLVGIVENVGIFVIDYANKHRADGLDKKEAIALATAVRFRPIFLTKVTALGSLLPLAILSPFWRGLSSVIVAGILTSGVLSLFTTPILYSWFDSWSKLPHILRNRFMKKAPIDDGYIRLT